MRPVTWYFDFVSPFAYIGLHRLKELPADVSMSRLPVPFLPNAANLQKLYFSLDEMGVANDLHLGVFAAVQRDHLLLETEDDLVSFALSRDLDPRRFVSVFGSPTVAQRQKGVNAVVDDLGIAEVPAIVVQGRYYITPPLAGGVENVVPVLDQVVDEVRRAWA